MLAKKKSGFTLIELLVVIAIIAILAAILFPVFARAREAARKSTCQSNMKECAIALQTYWNDYDATLPASASTTNAWTDAEYRKFGGSVVGILQPPQPVALSWCQKLWNSMRTKDIMFCPSDSEDRNDGTKASSYWWKLAIDQAWWSATMKCRKEGDFGYNADQICFYESRGFHSSAQQGLRNDVMINVAFLDSHVKSVSIANSTAISTAAHVYDPVASGEPNYFNFDNNRARLVSNPPAAGDNPPKADTPVANIDPRQFSDSLP